MIVVDTNVISYLYLSGERSHQPEQLLSLDSCWKYKYTTPERLQVRLQYEWSK